MPKDRRARSISSDRSRAFPYSINSKNADLSKNRTIQAGDKKEWEEARCPICMEIPHNAVLLLCSSHDKGCRPFMCDTSCRHSNCLDQFHKSSAAKSSGALAEVILSNPAHQRGSEEGMLGGTAGSCGREKPELVCPLCRGQINGSIVIEPARRFMNSRPRSCSLETCDFNGTYSELRRHARLVHPSVWPSEVDPQRQRDWLRMERERESQDILSAFQLDNRSEESNLNEENLMWLENELWSVFNAVENSESEGDDWSQTLLMAMDFESLASSLLGELFTPDS